MIEIVNHQSYCFGVVVLELDGADLCFLPLC